MDALFHDEIFQVIFHDLKEEAFDARAGGSARARNDPCLFVKLTQAALADCFDDGVLGGKEAVDIGRRHAKLARDIGHGRLGKAKPAKQRFRGFDDTGSGIIRFGFGLCVHGATAFDD